MSNWVQSCIFKYEIENMDCVFAIEEKTAR